MFRDFLTGIASHGFLVVAIGPASVAMPGGTGSAGFAKSSELLDAIDWAIAQNGKDGEYRGKIDTRKVAVMGQSLGGLQALEVSTDPRVTTTVLWNSGVFNTPPRFPGGAPPPSIPGTPAPPSPPRGTPPPGMSFPAVTKEMLKKLHAPIAYFVGGPSDIACQNAADDFARIQRVPVLLANRDVGHYPATFLDPHGGAFAAAGVAWLKWQLKGDKEARKMFVGEPCGLQADPNWTVQRKNLRD
jgi:dienelactone hydrolase